jgi:hypothetical protein
MLVLEEELRPDRLASHGKVGSAGAELLDTHIQHLVDLTRALIDETDAAR